MCDALLRPTRARTEDRRGRKRPGTRHVPFPQFNQERQSGKTQFFHHFRISVAIHENGTFPRGGEPFFRVIDKAHLLLVDAREEERHHVFGVEEKAAQVHLLRNIWHRRP